MSAYDTVLEANPRHPDAVYNRALVVRLMEQLRQQSRQQQQQGGSSDEEHRGGNTQEDGSLEDQDTRDAMDQGQDAGRRRDDAGRDDAKTAAREQTPQPLDDPPLTAEEQQAMAQWLRRIPDDPGGLLRRKFQLEHSKRRRERPQGTDAW